MALEVKSGASADKLTVDPLSKAARASFYDLQGNYRGVKATFRGANASSGFAAAAGTGVFFVIGGSASKTIIVQRILVTGPTLTAVAYNSILCNKYSTTAFTGGTPVTFTRVPVDSGNTAVADVLVQGYTAAPTPGTLVGAVGNQRLLLQSTTAAAGGLPLPAAWDFRIQGENSGLYLRGLTQSLGLAFSAAPASAVTLCVEVEWTEE